MRSTGIRVTAALVLTWGAAVPCPAEGPLEPPELERYLRWGPVRARPGFLVSDLGYDDNVYHLADSDPRPRIGDWRVTLSPRLDGLVLFGDRAFLTFDGRLDYRVYKDEHQLDSLDPHVTGRATLPLGRWGLFLDGAYHRTEDFPIDQQDIRNEVTERRFGAGAILELGWRSSAELGVYRADWTNRDPDAVPVGGFTVADRLNRDEDEIRLTLEYRVMGRTDLFFETAGKDIVFDNPAVMRDAKERRWAPGIRFGEGGRLTGSIRIGHAEIDAEDPAAPDFRGTVWKADLARRLGFGTTIRLGAERDARFSVYESQYYEDAAYEVTATHFLNRIFGLEARGQRRTLRFSESVRKDRLLAYDLGVKLRLQETGAGRQVLYTVRIGEFERKSTIPALDQSRTTYTINAEFGY